MAATKTSVRGARDDDLDVIVEFNRRLALETERKSLDRETLVAGVRTALADPRRARYFLAERDGRVVGQAMLTLEWSDWRNGEIWWFQSVYVHADHRRSGVFRSLFDHVHREAESQPDVVGLRLYVEEENHTAQETYRRLGLAHGGYQVMERLFVTISQEERAEYEGAE